MIETPAQRAARLRDEVTNAEKASYTKGEVKNILHVIAQQSDT